ncbi:methyltransferase domain-containing protein [bacterium]|nr:methyltransferase domain-containing protein [bacterium]
MRPRPPGEPRPALHHRPARQAARRAPGYVPGPGSARRRGDGLGGSGRPGGDGVSDAAARPWYERAFGAAYPVVYAHRDEAEARTALDLCERLLDGVPPGPWLDLGCGQGRHLKALAERGRDVVGLDLSPELLRLARDESPSSRLIRADMCRLPLRPASMSAVLSLFTAFGYFEEEAAHRGVVQGIARSLRPGGAWLLDYLDADRVADELAAGDRVRERRSGPLVVLERRRLVAAPRRVVKEVRLEPAAGAVQAAAALGVPPAGLEYDETVALFTLDELDALAGSAGLERVAGVGSYAGAPLRSGESDRWILVFARPSPRKDGP